MKYDGLPQIYVVEGGRDSGVIGDLFDEFLGRRIVQKCAMVVTGWKQGGRDRDRSLLKSAFR
jgi:hypothetical protein